LEKNSVGQLVDSLAAHWEVKSAFRWDQRWADPMADYSVAHWELQSVDQLVPRSVRLRVGQLVGPTAVHWEMKSAGCWEQRWADPMADYSAAH